jgi:mRNA-degrading endonuclease toxin of MazEF toxin-antitoxin module
VGVSTQPKVDTPVTNPAYPDALTYLSTVTVAPVTSTIRGAPSEVVLNEEDGMKSPCAVNLQRDHCISAEYLNRVSQQRLGRRVAQLSPARMNEVCAALRFSLGCDSNY